MDQVTNQKKNEQILVNLKLDLNLKIELKNLYRIKYSEAKQYRQKVHIFMEILIHLENTINE